VVSFGARRFGKGKGWDERERQAELKRKDEVGLMKLKEYGSPRIESRVSPAEVDKLTGLNPTTIIIDGDTVDIDTIDKLIVDVDWGQLSNKTIAGLTQATQAAATSMENLARAFKAHDIQLWTMDQLTEGTTTQRAPAGSDVPDLSVLPAEELW
jgi:hypothetical protein